MIEMGFMPNKKGNKPIVRKRGRNKFLDFNVPEGAKPGQTMTVMVDGLAIVVTLPITLPNGNIPKTNERITVPIEKSLNDSIYENIKKTRSKSGSNLEFIPTLIEAQYSNDKHLNLEKMVKPSKNQKFKISNAEIIKHKNPVHTSQDNFKFKPLIEYDKNISQLVFDIEVDVNLTLNVSENLSKEESKKRQEFEAKYPVNGILNKVKRGVTSVIINGGNNCPSRMRKLKQYGSAMMLGITPQPSAVVAAAKKNIAAAGEANKVHGDAIAARNANIASGRPGVRRGGRKTRRKNKRRRKTRRKNKRRRKTRRKNKRRRKTRRQKGGIRSARRNNRVHPVRESLWRQRNTDAAELPMATIVPNSELPLGQEVVVGRVHETPRQHMIKLAKKCKNKFDGACRTMKRMVRRELSGSGRKKRKTRRKTKRH